MSVCNPNGNMEACSRSGGVFSLRHPRLTLVKYSVKNAQKVPQTDWNEFAGLRPRGLRMCMSGNSKEEVAMA